MYHARERSYPVGVLLKRFSPYLFRYKGLLILDLVCAFLTTLCDIVLPKIMSYLTNSAGSLTFSIVIRLAALYGVLRIIDAVANFFMASQGHIMGVHIETDMRRDAFDHLQEMSLHVLREHQDRTDHGTYHKRPVRRNRVRPPLS
jgi:ATP-binding cassette subfamily B protein